MSDLIAFAVSSPEVVGSLGFALGVAAGVVWKGKRPNVFARRPKFTPGQAPTVDPQTAPPQLGRGQHHIFNPSELASAYNLMISTCTPRPIALVSTRSKPKTSISDDDKNNNNKDAVSCIDNVAPFSYFNVVAHDPPMLTIGFCRKGRDRQQKDSLQNILDTREFVVNLMSEWYLDAANHACGNFANEVDEFVESGLQKVEDCQVVRAPRVGQAAVAYECRLHQVIPVTNDDGQPTTEIVVARIVRVHVDDAVVVPDVDLSKPQVDTTKLKPIGRLGGNIYTSLGDLVDIPRPKV